MGWIGLPPSTSGRVSRSRVLRVKVLAKKVRDASEGADAALAGGHPG